MKKRSVVIIVLLILAIFEGWYIIGRFRKVEFGRDIAKIEKVSSAYSANERGIKFLNEKKYSDAILSFNEALKEDSGNVIVKKNLASAYLLSGEEHYNKGELIPTLSDWENALKLDSSDERILKLVEKVKKEISVESGFRKGQSGFFKIKFDGEENRSVADEVLKILEKARDKIRYDLGFFELGEIEVILYSNEQFRDITDSPSWSGGGFDGKIRIPIGNYKEDKALLEKMLYHEFTHAVVFAMTKGNCPTWLNEGLAMYMEGTRKNNMQLQVLDTPILLSKLSDSFLNMDAKSAYLAYFESFYAVEYLIKKNGFESIKQILKELGDGENIDTAMKEGINRSLSEFEREWMENLKEGLGG